MKVVTAALIGAGDRGQTLLGRMRSTIREPYSLSLWQSGMRQGVIISVPYTVSRTAWHSAILNIWRLFAVFLLQFTEAIDEYRHQQRETRHESLPIHAHV